MSDENNIYKLLSNRKYKTLYKIIESNPKLITKPLKNNKSLINYVIQINNRKLLDKLLKLMQYDDKLSLPPIALKEDLYDLFFYLLEKIDVKNVKTEDINLTNLVINKKDFELFNKYFEKYNKLIDWSNVSLLNLIINNPKNIDQIIEMMKIIIKINKNNLEQILKNPLNGLIKLYYNQKDKIITIDQIKRYIDIHQSQLNYNLEYDETCIYIISENNDLELLKYCVEKGANINHITTIGSYNFCHHIMLISNLEIIDYILTLDIDCNYRDSYNQTPIFSLISNKNILIDDNKSIKLISKLLEKTEDWDLQNVHGNTIIHVLVQRSDIEKFYPILKTRYFDIQIKNHYSKTPIELLEKISIQKLDEFKKLISKNKPKKNISTDDILLDKYQHTPYNLSNARLREIYIYYIILLKKYKTIGIPLDNKLDETKLFSLSKFEKDSNIIDVWKETNIYPYFYCQIIYWSDSMNYLIPYNILDRTQKLIKNGKQFIVIFISIMAEISHANILLIDVNNKRIIRFEPYGGLTKHNDLDDVLSNLFYKDYKYYKPCDYQPKNGLQRLSQENNLYFMRFGDIGGFCLAWTFWFIEFYIKNSNKKLNLLIPKAIKKIINSGYIITDYIRDYANYLHQQLVEFLSKNGYSNDFIYTTEHRDKEWDHLYKLIHSNYDYIFDDSYYD